MTENDNTTSRRELLKSSSGALAIPIAGNIKNSNLGPLEGGSVTIVTEKQGSETLQTVEVPEEWYNHHQHVKHISKTLSERYSNYDAVKDVAVEITSSRITEELFRSRPVIKVWPDAEWVPELPSTTDGVDVRIDEAQEARPLTEIKGSHLNNCPSGCEYFCQEYDPVPGGVPVSADYSPNRSINYQRGTAGFPAKDPNGNQGIVTAKHLFYCPDLEDEEQGTLFQGDWPSQYNNIFGEISSFSSPDHVGDNDWVFVNSEVPNSDVNVSNQLITSYEVQGHVTESGVDYLFASSANTIRRVGPKLGKTTGHQITEINQCIDSCTEKCNYIEVNTDSCSGESGCPFYIISDDESGSPYVSILGTLYGEPNSTVSPAYAMPSGFEVGLN